MKKIIYLFIALIVFAWWLFSISNAQDDNRTWWKFAEHNPVQLLDTINTKVNWSEADKVQDTQLNNVTSRAYCELWVKSNFTITKTLCYIKENIKNYLQYVVYIWLVVATIIVIWNWFLLVTSSNKETQMTNFKKNMERLAIWIVLIIGFYFILDVFVSIVNFVAQ